MIPEQFISSEDFQYNSVSPEYLKDIAEKFEDAYEEFNFFSELGKSHA